MSTSSQCIMREKNVKGHKQKGERKTRTHVREFGDPNCPIMHFKKFTKLLNPKCIAMFQCLLATFQLTRVWYDKAPVGYHTLADMMKTMSWLKLSQEYTNHCIRKYCLTTLADVRFKAKDIMTITGHRNVSSLEPYLGCPSVKRQKMMCEHTIDGIWHEQ